MQRLVWLGWTGQLGTVVNVSYSVTSDEESVAGELDRVPDEEVPIVLPRAAIRSMDEVNPRAFG